MTASTAMPVSKMAARAGAIRRPHARFPAGVAGEERDHRDRGQRVQQEQAEPAGGAEVEEQVLHRRAPASANAPMTASPVALWAREAVLGMLLLPVRLSTPGSTPSRPSANAYRHTQLWKASMAANSWSGTATGRPATSTPLPRPNSSPGPCAAAAATTWPVAGVGGHGPGRRGVHDADHAQREVGGDRDGPPRVPGLLAEHGGLLEPGEAEHGDHGQHPEGAEPGRGQGRRGQRREAQVPAGRGGQARDCLGDDDDDLQRRSARPAPCR